LHKGTVIIANIIEAALAGNLSDFHIRIQQELAALSDPEATNIGKGGFAGQFFEVTAKGSFA
jgi:hypothetical protein